MNILLNIRCPHCGTLHKITFELKSLHHTDTVIVRCDTEEAEGCGNQFLAEAFLKAETKLYQLTPPVEKKWRAFGELKNFEVLEVIHFLDAQYAPIKSSFQSPDDCEEGKRALIALVDQCDLTLNSAAEALDYWLNLDKANQ